MEEDEAMEEEDIRTMASVVFVEEDVVEVTTIMTMKIMDITTMEALVTRASG